MSARSRRHHNLPPALTTRSSTSSSDTITVDNSSSSFTSVAADHSSNTSITDEATSGQARASGAQDKDATPPGRVNKRVAGLRKGFRRNTLPSAAVDTSADTEIESNGTVTVGLAEASGRRTVSGETLVEKEGVSGKVDATGNASQSSLLHLLPPLNLRWSMASFFRSTAELNEDGLGAGNAAEEDNAMIACDKSAATPSIKDKDMEEEVEQKTPRSVLMKERAERVEAKRVKEEAERVQRIKQDAAKATRRSSRVPLLERATAAVDAAGSVLGKRSRDVLEKGKGGLKRMASLRSRNPEEPKPSFEGPVAKRLRLESAATEEPETKPVSKPVARRPAKKTWLNHGLYIGQNRHFDPRMTDEKNKQRLALKPELLQTKERKILPMPMFAGQRLVERGRDFKLPFDVFSPLPPGQPKPDEWRKVNKNVFVGDAGSIWRHSKQQEYSTCLCSRETGCDEDCQNRYMFYECDESNCRLEGEACGNRAFAGLRQRTKAGGKYNVGVEVIKTLDRGYGVRSNRTFEPNQIIVEYTGEIITQDECEDRMKTIYKDNECYYLMLFDQNMIIDATRGSIARFVNHSCEPNCRMEKWTVAGKPRMALFAGDKGIMTGEELTYDYNFDPFSQKNVQECRCGSEKCRGVLGPKPKEQSKRKESEETDKKEGKLAKAKRKFQAVLDESTSKLNKKRKIVATTASSANKSKAKTTSRSKAIVNKAKSRSSAKTVKKFVKGRTYTTTSANSSREKLLNKKSSSRSVASAKARPKAVPVSRPSKAKRFTAAMKKRPSVRTSSARSPKSKAKAKGTRTVSSTSSTLSIIKNVARKEEPNETPPAIVDTEMLDAETFASARPLSRRDSIRRAAESAKRNVVRTVRGAAGGKERTVRVIG